MADEEDDELVKAARAGDAQALADLLEGYRDRLRRMVTVRMDARVRGRLDASDVIQEAFVEVARRVEAKKVSEGIPFFLWLRMVTGDQLAQLHRRHLGTDKRDAAREVRLNNSTMPSASSVSLANRLAGQFTSVDRGLKREEVRAKLEHAVNSMDENDREIIAMRHFEELSTDEIATLLEMTRSGVLKRYTRAIRRLSESINTASDISIG